MRLIVVTCLAAAAFALAGCKSNCRQLSERLCECTINSLERDSCLRTAGAAEGANPPDADDEVLCAHLLKPLDGGLGCDCRLIDTTQGKIACGLARDNTAPSTP
ncbi:MAG: hypothetical protein JNK82_33410 [Myxococcaceae bacterium]|nr:hypothetical protein [Myxococcaceae bacterium]